MFSVGSAFSYINTHPTRHCTPVHCRGTSQKSHLTHVLSRPRSTLLQISTGFGILAIWPALLLGLGFSFRLSEKTLSIRFTYIDPNFVLKLGEVRVKAEKNFVKDKLLFRRCKFQFRTTSSLERCVFRTSGSQCSEGLHTGKLPISGWICCKSLLSCCQATYCWPC